ncbi:hypothetical protein L1S32_10470 [Methanogenium sp. S4BF]|uniref:hypothetical protein n=1 Tax=Methanogenium sp. S4BF TaxID=1789226 RepID=UPI002415C909|nr:hypothetical protein [Methanogenium sp. S4BF]WFN34255.1 hypothetical protein L1S32_10470 [Methanogenium sp. S4BF]
MTQTSFTNSTESTGYRITNPKRFRAAARVSGNSPPDEPDEMIAVRLTAEIIREYTGDRADTLMKTSGQPLETAALWDEAGYEPPRDVQMLVEILHRIHAGT